MPAKAATKTAIQFSPEKTLSPPSLPTNVAMDETRALFARPTPPDALFVASDHMAFGVLEVLREELGLRVPQEVAVVGYDDVPMADRKPLI